MAEVQLHPSSWLHYADLLETTDGFVFWGHAELPEFPEQPDDRWLTLDRNARIDLLANDYLGDQKLWWVIAIANEWDLVPSDMVVNARVRIPALRFVQRTLADRRRAGA